MLRAIALEVVAPDMVEVSGQLTVVMGKVDACTDAFGANLLKLLHLIWLRFLGRNDAGTGAGGTQVNKG